MIVVIIAGGSGTRLWPLSTPEYPKHLLSIVGDNSLLQNTFERVKKITSIDKIYISTEASHSDFVIQQLPELKEVQVIVEPARRDTMPCILNALQFISTRHDKDEPIASIHADSHIRDTSGFARGIKLAGLAAQKYQRITLMGMEPHQPDVKYGYIHKDEIFDSEDFIYEIASFKEKPAYEVAKDYFESGEYFWNMGYFVAPYKVFEKKIREHADSKWSDQLNKLQEAESQAERDVIYLGFDKEAIDTALMEKVPDLLVMPGSFDWIDVGSFDDVHRVSLQDQDGNAVKGKNIHLLDSRQVYVRNDDVTKPVAVIGLDNITVVNTEHGILVMRTDQSQKVKEVVARLDDI
ncbi:mannose-1-phosphate guanylyltransferase [Candidatus Saccharibacteria bacterium]|nr:mannose-1-phosphate guanylyltransferase [Candidatus Saccharibacteria bacterium]